MKKRIILIISYCLLIIVLLFPVVLMVSCSTDVGVDEGVTVHIFDNTNNGKGECFKISSYCNIGYGTIKVAINNHYTKLTAGMYIFNYDGYCPICGK